jgi:hypothetical protein
MQVKLKLRSNKLLTFEKVKNTFVENGFFVIAHSIKKFQIKFEPIALENIDYWIEIKK